MVNGEALVLMRSRKRTDRDENRQEPQQLVIEEIVKNHLN